MNIRFVSRLIVGFCACAIFAGTTNVAAQSYDELSPRVREYVAVSEPVVALTRVRIIDGTGAAPAEDRTIVINHGRIAAVGPTGEVEVPENARVLELAGHTVIPGIVGMHDHMYYSASGRRVQSSYSSPRLYLASGVTTIRTTGSFSTYAELNLRRSIRAGDVPGPRMHVTGPYITGAAGGGGMSRVASPEAARRLVDYWAEEGVTWFKFYTTISRAAMEAAIDAAHERGLKLTGHLCSVSFREAALLGIDNIEHGFLTNSGWAEGKTPDECPPNMIESLRRVEIDSDEVQATIRTLVENEVPLTSTLVVYEQYVPNRPPIQQRVLEAMSPGTERAYLQSRAYIAGGEGFHIPLDLFHKAMAFERAFVEAGGLLAAGVDPAGTGGAVPGFGDQRNYVLLREAGISPEQAIQILGLNGARVLGVDDELGSIAVGKAADLVVIEGDPTVDGGHIRNVEIVFKDGVGYDSAELIEAVEGQLGIN